MTGQSHVNAEQITPAMNMHDVMTKVSSRAENQIIQVLFPLAYNDNRIEGDADG